MKQIDINSVEELLKELNGLPNNYIYRGHANAQWRLESSLERVIGAAWSAESATKFEEYSFDVFKSKFHLYDNENLRPDSKLAWLSIMQHYGVPTRLLDFTESPYVALYFALEAYNPQMRSDFAVFAIDYSSVMQKSIAYISEKDPTFHETRQSIHKNHDAIFEDVVDKFAYDIAWIAEPRLLNARLDRQAGSFLLSGNRSRRIEEVLASPTYITAGITKYRIANDLYRGLFALLRKMNVTSKSLYGDLEGLARSIRMELQLYSV
jgi:hypothetical protein